VTYYMTSERERSANHMIVPQFGGRMLLSSHLSVHTSRSEWSANSALAHWSIPGLREHQLIMQQSPCLVV
jgi:hypothetical protein